MNPIFLAELTTPEWAAPLIALLLSAFTSGVVNKLFKNGLTTAKNATLTVLDGLVAENKLSTETSTKVQNLIAQTETILLIKVNELTEMVTQRDGTINQFVEGARTQSVMVDKVLDFLNEYDDEIAEVAMAFLADVLPPAGD